MKQVARKLTPEKKPQATSAADEVNQTIKTVKQHTQTRITAIADDTDVESNVYDTSYKRSMTYQRITQEEETQPIGEDTQGEGTS